MASPAWPAPMITVVTYEFRPLPCDLGCASVVQSHHDRDVGRVGDDVVNRGALLRLRYERLDVFALGVGVNVVRHLDAVVAIAHIAVDAKDALDVHVAFDRRLDRTQLNVAMLGDGGDAGGQAARQPDQHILHRRDAVVFGGKHLRMIGVERESLFVALLLAEAVIAFDGRTTERAVFPFDGRAPFELRGLGALPSASRAAIKASVFTPFLAGVLLVVVAIGYPPYAGLKRTGRF